MVATAIACPIITLEHITRVACPTVESRYEPKHNEIDVCTLTSCLRSRARPKNAAMYADPCVEVELLEEDHWKFTKQIIPDDFFGPVERTAVDPYTEEYRKLCVRDLANALRRAQDMANGRGVLDDDDEALKDNRSWTGASHVSAHEVRKPPLVWEEGLALRYADDDDGFASYGRDPESWVIPTIISIPADSAEADLSRAGFNIHDFLHLGDVPERISRHTVVERTACPSGIPLSDLESVRSKLADVQATAKACASVRSPDLGAVVKLWLQDTGCGHDLVGMQEIKHSRT